MSQIDNARRKANVLFVRSLKNKPCMDCGQLYHYEVMEFDHKRDKHFNLSKPRHLSHARILEEVSKCDLVCANCHRMRTWKRRQENIFNKIKERDLFD